MQSTTWDPWMPLFRVAVKLEAVSPIPSNLSDQRDNIHVADVAE